MAGLVAAAQSDVTDIRQGLPQGAQQLDDLFVVAPPAAASSGEPPSDAVPAAELTDAGLAAVADGGGAEDAGAVPPSDAGSPDDAGSAVDSGTVATPDGTPAGPGLPDPATVRAALERARDKVQSLRVAKSTFFAVATRTGVVLRNDQDQDLMAGKGLFGSFPELKKALTGKCVETMGSLEEAATIKNRPDAQWVMACPIQHQGEPRGLYVTGWGWSAYARRLQLAVVSEIQDQLQPGQNEPLVYVVVVVGDHSYGWDVPDVTLNYVNELQLPGKIGESHVYGEVAEITGRKWGIAAISLPVFTGEKVIGVVARSET